MIQHTHTHRKNKRERKKIIQTFAVRVVGSLPSHDLPHHPPHYVCTVVVSSHDTPLKKKKSFSFSFYDSGSDLLSFSFLTSYFFVFLGRNKKWKGIFMIARIGFLVIFVILPSWKREREKLVRLYGFLHVFFYILLLSWARQKSTGTLTPVFFSPPPPFLMMCCFYCVCRCNRKTLTVPRHDTHSIELIYFGLHHGQ